MIMLIDAVVFPFQVRPLMRHQPEAGFTEDPEHSTAVSMVLVAVGGSIASTVAR